MKLNLGSGKRDLDGYINIDAVKHTESTVIADILCLDYTDDSIDEIYSEHVVEHLDRNELDRFFSECKRMLKPGGILTIIAPCLTKAIEKYNKGELEIDYLDNFLFALHLHKYDYHKQGIYKEKLNMLCDRHSFTVLKMEYQHRDHSLNEIVLIARAQENKNV